MRIKTALFIFITIIAFLFNCGKSDETYTIEIKDGVNYVHNIAPAWGDEPKVEIEFVQKIGEYDTEDENYMLYRVMDIARDSDGNIYVVDAGNYRIQKYDSNGQYLATFGRKGQGPSEFEYPRSIGLASNGNMYIYDQGNSRISVLSKEGRELRTFKFGERAAEFQMLRSDEFITKNISGIITDSFDALSEPVTEYTLPLIQIYSNKGELLREFGKPFDYKDIFVNRSGNQFYSCSDNNNFIYITFMYHNRVEKYSSEGELLLTVDRPLSYEISRPKTIVKEFEGGARGILSPKMNMVSRGIGIDNHGRIWVMTFTRQPEKNDPEPYFELEIYDNEGIFLYEIPWAEEFTPISIHTFGAQVFFVDLEGISVYEYKIVEK